MPAHFCEKCGRPKAVVGIVDNKKEVVFIPERDVFEIVNGQIWACLKCNRKAIIDEMKKENKADG